MDDLVLTVESRDYLISCEKEISKPPKRTDKYEDGHYRNEFFLESTDKKHIFKAFTRRNKVLAESFSVGLLYCHPSLGEVLLSGVNGPHKSRAGYHPFPHIHRISQNDIDRGWYKNPKDVVIAEEYTDFLSALNYFCNEVKIKEYKKEIPLCLQSAMDDFM